MAQKWSDLRAKMTPERQASIATRTETLLLEMDLSELRKSRDFVQALGGELKLIASFPDGEVQIHPARLRKE